MNRDGVDRVARAVLYEGYMLYPYRRSSLKNQQRWSFGVLFRRNCRLVRDGLEVSRLRTECLVEGGADAFVDARVRFLHLVTVYDGSPMLGESASWQEAVEREAAAASRRLGALESAAARIPFHFEPIAGCGDDRRSTTQEPIAGALVLSAERLDDGLHRIAVEVDNLTEAPDAVTEGRESELMRALVSAHLVLEVRGGAFVSLLEPPARFREAALTCRNAGWYPVLVGRGGDRDAMLASPIILYDYPEVAGESAGDFYDATEIDEMLALRVMTLSDAEREELIAGDPRARAILERTSSLDEERLARLHGAIRSLRPTGGDTP